jgi:hypothetical protein
MPAPGFVVSGGLPDRIIAALAEKPGLRTAELSRLLFPDATNRSAATLAVGAECSRLYRTGRIARHQVSPPGRKVPITRYRLPDPEPATT